MSGLLRMRTSLARMSKMAMHDGRMTKMLFEKVTVKSKKRQSLTGVKTPSLQAAILLLPCRRN